MFTGIIERIASVVQASRERGLLKLTLDLGEIASEVRVGESIAVDGVCLTVADLRSGCAHFDVSQETMRLTTLGDLRPGDHVNVERALRVGDRIGGHFVQGHVDGVGEIVRKEEGAGQCLLGCRVTPALTRQMVLKGSVAVDGISLTICYLEETLFEVALIPHTLANTTLQFKRVGARVNIETDIIGKWVARFLEKTGGGLTEEKLREHGFA